MPPKKEVPAPIANAPTKASEQPSMVRVPDNAVFGDTPALIKEGLAAMGGATGKPPAAPPDSGDAKPADVAPAQGKEAAQTEQQDGPAAKGWAAVKKAEAKLREERERFDENRKITLHQLNQMKAESEALKQQTQTQAVDIRAAFSRDPFGVLKNQFGVTLNDLAQLALNDQSALPRAQHQDDPEKKTLLEKLDRLERLVQQRDHRDQLKEYTDGIDRALESDEYSLLQTLPNAKNEVMDFAAGYLKKTGELLRPEKAAAKILAFWEQHLSKVSSHKAARRVLGLPDPDESGANGKPALRPKGPKKTLTNQLSSSSPAVPHDLPSDMTEEQELRLAAKLIPENAWDKMT